MFPTLSQIFGILCSDRGNVRGDFRRYGNRRTLPGWNSNPRCFLCILISMVVFGQEKSATRRRFYDTAVNVSPSSKKVHSEPVRLTEVRPSTRMHQTDKKYTPYSGAFAVPFLLHTFILVVFGRAGTEQIPIFGFENHSPTKIAIFFKTAKRRDRGNRRPVSPAGAFVFRADYLAVSRFCLNLEPS